MTDDLSSPSPDDIKQTDAPGDADGSDAAPKKKTTRKKPAAKKTAKKPAAKATAPDAGDDAEPAAATRKKKTTKKAAAKAEPDAEGAPEAGAVEAPDAGAKKAAKKSTKKRVTKKKAAKPGSGDGPAADAVGEGGEIEPGPEPEDATPGAPAGDGAGATESEGEAGSDAEGASKGKKRRRRRKKGGKVTAEEAAAATDAAPARTTLSEDDDADEPSSDSTLEMIINYVPGEECRVAITENGQLEELFAEPTDQVSRVGNIYVGKVINVEASIQAAFVDFGCEENGFLHISDLHPQYFGDDDEATERVGKKTPRRDRPPMQEALRRGQEITVQVLKEGVGTKGPTLTSYLSIPGRFLVMMPGMDKVGVSRKEEDDERRRAAKDILSQLELPEGFGFILRTAGFDRTKAELKRDLAYLMRLWKDMERRRKGGNKPRPLYAESDLLLRSIRDLMTSDIRRVVIDSEPALRRAAQFIKIAAPRAQAKLARYVGGSPIFHAFGIEHQIEAIHAREVPLPSGGRLVIDQTEALVAIDVNSGKSRSARDAETNAFRTNMEAVDAICRQLRLRDLGGLVVNDLIDMRYASHRKQVEQRFIDRLKRDRAKTTVGHISEFGLLEMTRQRMRGSMESQHFADCPMCRGRGLVQKPDSVAATALRDLAAIVDHEKVSSVEMVVHPRVAGALLSTRRTALTRVELHSGKQIEVRVSEALALDRVTFYAYDHNGNDLGLEKMTGRAKRPEPKVAEWVDDTPDAGWAVDPAEEADETTAQKLTEEIARLAEEAGPQGAHPFSADAEQHDEGSGEGGKKKRRRRRRRGRGRSGEGAEADAADLAAERDDAERPPTSDQQDADEEDDRPESDDHAEDRQSQQDGEGGEGGEGGKKKRRRRRRRGRGRSGEGEHADEARDDGSRRSEAIAEPKPGKPETKPEAAPAAPKAEPKPKRRGLYAGARRKLAPSEVARISPD
jgi:ribonuclease E